MAEKEAQYHQATVRMLLEDWTTCRLRLQSLGADTVEDERAALALQERVMCADTEFYGLRIRLLQAQERPTTT